MQRITGGQPKAILRQRCLGALTGAWLELRKSETLDGRGHHDHPCILSLLSVDHLAPQPAGRLADSSIYSLRLCPDASTPAWGHILRGPRLKRTLSLKHEEALGTGPNPGGENGLLRAGRRRRSHTSQCGGPFSWAESSRLGRKCLHKAGMAQGSPGKEHVWVGEGKSTGGSPAGTN